MKRKDASLLTCRKGVRDLFDTPPQPFRQALQKGSGYLPKVTRYLFAGVLVCSPFLAQALTCTANTGTVNWTTIGTWSCGRIPINVDDVIIPNASIVTLTAASTITSLTVQNGGTLNLNLTGNAMPTVSGTKTFDTTSTVNYNFAGNQNISPETYGNLSVSTSGTKTPLAGTFNIVGNFVINTGPTWAGNTNNPVMNIGGNITRTGTYTSGTGMHTFNGAGTQTISAGITITNVTISNTSTQGLSLTATHTFTNLTMPANSVMSLAGTTTAFPTNTTRSMNASSTVRVVGTGTQTLAAGTFGNIVLGGSGAKRHAAGTTTVLGNYTKEATPTYAGTNNPVINISGNMDISGAYTTGTGAISVTGNLNVNAAATLNLNRTPAAMPTVTGTKTFNATSTVSYNANANQNVSAETYGNLSVSGTSGTRVKTPLAGTINIVGNFTIGNFSSWAGNTNNPILNISGNITRTGTFTSGTGMHTFNGTGTQTISAAVTITNATISNPSTEGLSLTLTHTFTNLTVAAGGVLTLAGTTTAFPTNTTRSFDSTSTVRFIGSGNQAIPAYNYGNLLTATGGVKTPAAGTVGVAGDLTIGGGTTWAGNTSNPAVNIGGNFLNSGTFTAGTNVYTFNGTNLQSVTGTVTFATLTITNTTAPSGVTLLSTITTTTLNVNAGAILTLGAATVPMPAGTKNLNATSTVRFAGTGAQAVPALTYGNLYVGGGSTKTPAAGTHTLAGSFTLDTATTWAGNTSNPTVSIAGDFTNSGTFTSGTGTYTFNGAALQTLTGATTFARFTINNSAPLPDPVVSLNNDLTVGTLLTITFGGIVTNANKVIIPNGSSISGASAGTGWIIGNLQKFIPAGGSTTTFEVGTLGLVAPQLAYTPASLTFTGVGGAGGSLIVSTALGDHPQIGTAGLVSTKTVNRWWNLTTTGVTGTALPAFTNYSPTFSFVTEDLDVGVNTANLFVNRYTGSAWAAPATGTRTATSTQATGVTALGQFALGEPVPVTVVKSSVVISDPTNGAVNPKRVPGAIIEYTVVITTDATAVASSTAVIATDNIQAGLTYVPGSLIVNGAAEDDDATNGGTSNPDVGNYNSGSSRITANLGTIAPSASKNFKFRVAVN